MNDLHPDFIFNAFHSADIVEIHLRPLDFGIGRGRLIGGGTADASIDDFPVPVRLLFPISGDAQSLGEFLVGDGRIFIDGAFVLANGSLDIAGAVEQFGVQHQRLGRRGAGFEQIFDDHQRVGILPLLIKRAGKPDFQTHVFGRESKRSPKFDFGFIVARHPQQGVGQVLTQRKVIGRDADRLAQAGDCVIALGHQCVPYVRGAVGATVGTFVGGNSAWSVQPTLPNFGITFT